MTSIKFFFLFIPILGCILLNLNFILAPHKPYKEKKTPFECGYHSFTTQNRTPFTISFFIFGMLFLLFDIEITTVFPFVVSSNFNDPYGFFIVISFILVLTLGFLFELGKNALKIDTKQDRYNLSKCISFKGMFEFLNKKFKIYKTSIFASLFIFFAFKLEFIIFINTIPDYRLALLATSLVIYLTALLMYITKAILNKQTVINKNILILAITPVFFSLTVHIVIYLLGITVSSQLFNDLIEFFVLLFNVHTIPTMSNFLDRIMVFSYNGNNTTGQGINGYDTDELDDTLIIRDSREVNDKLEESRQLQDNIEEMGNNLPANSELKAEVMECGSNLNRESSRIWNDTTCSDQNVTSRLEDLNDNYTAQKDNLQARINRRN